MMNLPTPQYQTIPMDVIGNNTFGRYKKISSAETFNMFVVDEAMVSFPGYQKVATMSEGGVARELFNSSKFNHLIAVVDNGVYIISQELSVQRIGTLATFTGQVFMADNLAGQIGIVDGLNVYIFNWINNTFQTISVDFRPVSIAYMDTYFICASGETNTWRLSGNSDGTVWTYDASHVGELQTKATNTISCIPLNRQLLVMGNTVTESWYDSGQQLFPFQRNNYYNLDYGTTSPETIAVNESLMVWLAINEKSGLAIMYTEGQKPEQLSTDGINYRLSKIVNPKSAFGFLYKLEGHLIYQLTFTDPQDNVTYIYDFTTKMFFTLTDEDQSHHIAKRIAFFNNSYYFISFKDGNLYEIGSEFTTFDGKEMPCMRVCSNFRTATSDRFFVNNATITMASGIGKEYQKVNLSISRDGGYSYDQIFTQKLFPEGRRRNKFKIWDLPSGNDIVFQWRFHSKDRFVIVHAEAEIYK